MNEYQVTYYHNTRDSNFMEKETCVYRNSHNSWIFDFANPSIIFNCGRKIILLNVSSITLLTQKFAQYRRIYKFV